MKVDIDAIRGSVSNDVEPHSEGLGVLQTRTHPALSPLLPRADKCACG